VSEGPYASILVGDVTLRTARFELKPLARIDAADLLEEFSDPEVVRFMDIEPHHDIAQTEAVIDWTASIRAEGVGLRWGIRELAGQAFVGTIGFNNLVWERGCRGEIGYDVRRDWWGRRVMDEVLPAVLQFGFHRLGLRRIEAMITPGNTPSCALLERHGFEREGVLREYGFWKDQFWDQIVYARLG
jgi:ribosomal-protein-alanine N-acetyltransferase